jgi:hypothetical protein
VGLDQRTGLLLVEAVQGQQLERALAANVGDHLGKGGVGIHLHVAEGAHHHEPLRLRGPG